MVQIEQIFLRPGEAARALGCSRTRVYELVHAGTLPHVRLGGTSIRIPKAAIQKLVDDAMNSRGGSDGPRQRSRARSATVVR
jgi:excisionase family DNA binding protein